MNAPPAVLTAAGHPVRWRLLTELARTDLAVRELIELLGQPQSLISYHLGKLRRSELVTARRSTADGRDTYYSLDLTRCAGLLSGAGGALHPALRLRPPATIHRAGARVLFLCTGNSARSPMAEALLRARTAGRVEAHSAGSRPKPIHPHAVTVLAARGIDLTGARPRHLDEFAGQRFDHVITLCDRVKEICPEFPGHRRPTHWSLPEPADLATFEQVADRLDDRIGHLSQLIASAKEAS
ncbi:ArsR family transcriptional regulator [Actinoplanes oblitus]|uniref:ArsR family transcriptional regulator n=1 Tax=Actinoplanes oblitus TaxID=3040509 RepID=A0ABY8W4H8_9ACTN|nr:MarR family transcriptional regulator [Actinoplanes oblitus]WIM92766.1 ArsR family transcriptional regulator [Actinoplanes oblitus]